LESIWYRKSNKKTDELGQRRGTCTVDEGGGRRRKNRLRGVKIGDGGRVMRIDGLQSSAKGRANLLASP
jgi:hypothetical protein